MSGPTIYYQDDLVTLWHGDCREALAWLEADVLVTDPPYGMAYSGFGGRKGEPRRASGPLSIEGDLDPAVRDDILALWGDRPALIFGTWRIPRPTNTRQVIVWDKSANGPGMGALDVPWGAIPRRGLRARLGLDWQARGLGLCGEAVHLRRPRQARPWATLLAAKALGRRAVGVELEERYCEVAAKRLAQDVLFGGVA